MKCPYCDHLQQDARFCENCGASLLQSQGYEYPDFDFGTQPPNPDEPAGNMRQESFTPPPQNIFMPPRQSYTQPERQNPFQPAEPQSFQARQQSFSQPPQQNFYRPPEPQNFFQSGPQGYFQPEQQSSSQMPPQNPDAQPQQAFFQQQETYRPPNYQPPQNPYRQGGQIYSDTHFSGGNNYVNTGSANGRTSASLVLGILSLLFLGFGCIMGIIAIVLGVSARRTLRQAGVSGGSATAGIVLGTISTVLFALVIFSLLSL